MLVAGGVAMIDRENCSENHDPNVAGRSISSPSPPHRHVCRSPRCASNNPDYAQPSPVPLRKFLVSKRHLLQSKPPKPQAPSTPSSGVRFNATPTRNALKTQTETETDNNTENTENTGDTESSDCEKAEVAVDQKDNCARDEYPFGGIVCSQSLETSNSVLNDHLNAPLGSWNNRDEESGDMRIGSGRDQNDDYFSDVGDVFQTPCPKTSLIPVEDCQELTSASTELVGEKLVVMNTQKELKHSLEVVAPMHEVVTQYDEDVSLKEPQISMEVVATLCDVALQNDETHASEEYENSNEIVAPLDVARDHDGTFTTRTKPEKKKVRGCRINNAIAEAHKQVSEPLGQGRVRHLVEAFENIISLAESEAEESRVIKFQGSDKTHHAIAGKGSQDLPTVDDNQAKEQPVASSSTAGKKEEVRVPAVPVKLLVDMYCHSKQTPMKPIMTVNPLEEHRLILGTKESEHIVSDNNSIKTCSKSKNLVPSIHNDQIEKLAKPTIEVNPLDPNRLVLYTGESDHRQILHENKSRFQAENLEPSGNDESGKQMNASTEELRSMIERHNEEMTSLARARSIDKVRIWNNGESSHHGNTGYELWKNLLNSPNVMDRGYLIARQRIETLKDHRLSVHQETGQGSKDILSRHDKASSKDERNLGSICGKEHDVKGGNNSGVEVDQESNFGVSVCNSFQSRRSGTAFGMHSRKPKSTCLQPFALRTEARGAKKKHDFARKLARMFAEEQRMRVPVAQGLPWTTDEPQAVPKPPVKESTVPLDIHLFSDIRACERAEFDAYVSSRLALMEEERQERERLKQIEEEEEIKRMRREMVPRAQLMPYFDRPFMPKRSSKRLTVPKEPSFQCDQNKRHKCKC